MNVHNIMEELVELEVNNIYEQIKQSNPSWFSCDCENCRNDTISYVLNRIPPKYVVSGRGITHSTQLLNDFQFKADLDVVVMDGIKIVNTTQRPFHAQSQKEAPKKKSSPAFNFPIFTGTVLDGSTFEPITNATVILKLNGKVVEMIDGTWINPYTTCKSTKGSYTFLAKPEDAKAANLTKKFNFGIEVSAPGYENATYYFELPITSDSTHHKELDSTYSLKLKDIVLFV